MLVPMLAPSVMAIAWCSFIMPELTKPMTMTVVAEEDWITEVTTAPSSMPFMGVLVILYKKVSSLFPATLFRPSPISDMPNRKSATPHSNDRIILKICILPLSCQ